MVTTIDGVDTTSIMETWIPKPLYVPYENKLYLVLSHSKPAPSPFDIKTRIKALSHRFKPGHKIGRIGIEGAFETEWHAWELVDKLVRSSFRYHQQDANGPDFLKDVKRNRISILDSSGKQITAAGVTRRNEFAYRFLCLASLKSGQPTRQTYWVVEHTFRGYMGKFVVFEGL